MSAMINSEFRGVVTSGEEGQAWDLEEERSGGFCWICNFFFNVKQLWQMLKFNKTE